MELLNLGVFGTVLRLIKFKWVFGNNQISLKNRQSQTPPKLEKILILRVDMLVVGQVKPTIKPWVMVSSRPS